MAEEQSALAQHKRERWIAQEVAWLRRGPEARRTKSKARIERARRLMAEQGYVRPRVAEFQVAAPPRLSAVVIEAEGLVKSYGGRVVLRGGGDAAAFVEENVPGAQGVAGGHRIGGDRVVAQAPAQGLGERYEARAGAEEQHVDAVRLGDRLTLEVLGDEHRHAVQAVGVVAYICHTCARPRARGIRAGSAGRRRGGANFLR